MKDEQFRIVSGKRRQVSHDVNEERLKQMKTYKPSLLDRLFSLFQPKKK
ncbi:MAG: hypothetical protein P9L94_03325 [Candidatus Hinthialibacter antarcticus]|nr:hypothetical protein [Candidatus Hinthialibacter antarcticus]